MEKYWLEFYISGKNCMLQPYIKSDTALSHKVFAILVCILYMTNEDTVSSIIT